MRVLSKDRQEARIGQRQQRGLLLQAVGDDGGVPQQRLRRRHWQQAAAVALQCLPNEASRERPQECRRAVAR